MAVGGVLLCGTLSTAACGGQPGAPRPAEASQPVSAAPTLAASLRPTPVPGADAMGIVWLCLPGAVDDPCTADLRTTVIDQAGHRTTLQPLPAEDPPIDCFYVYPTTSRQTTMNADLSIDPELRARAAEQAALFSQVCRVFAPVYPQLTIAALGSGAIKQANVQAAFDGVRVAFDDYMATYNHGRGVVLIGHSQGAMLLDDLLHYEIDPKPAVRGLLVSALLLGGNVMMAARNTAVGDFANIRACSTATQTGCVVGYSSFAGEPPPDAAFGRVDGALTMLPLPRSGRQQLLCVNPSAPGGTGTLLPVFPTAAVAALVGRPDPVRTTPFVAYPGAFTAECRTNGDATWLQVTPASKARAIPVLTGSEGPAWGLHDLDVSLGIGNLVELVRAQAAAFGS